MPEQSSVMQSCCVSTVDAACLSFSRLGKVAHLHGSKPWNGSFDGLDLVGQVHPQSKRSALVARRASALHSRNILAEKYFSL